MTARNSCPERCRRFSTMGRLLLYGFRATASWDLYEGHNAELKKSNCPHASIRNRSAPAGHDCCRGPLRRPKRPLLLAPTITLLHIRGSTKTTRRDPAGPFNPAQHHRVPTSKWHGAVEPQGVCRFFRAPGVSTPDGIRLRHRRNVWCGLGLLAAMGYQRRAECHHPELHPWLAFLS